MAGTDQGSGVAARRLALDALVRIEQEGSYANLVTPALLDTSDLPDRDRHFVTELVYGTTRMRRACDYLVDRHRRGKVAPRVRAALRIGAYQLAFAGTAPHAAVSATVSASPKPARGLVNAVLRRVADDVAAGVEWPDEPTRLSYPDWLVRALADRLGDADARRALDVMNLPATTHTRADGYVQDAASQAVVDLVEATAGMIVLDTCAAPGGKATGLAATGARVVAGDRSMPRARLIIENAERLGANVPTIVADGRHLPVVRGAADRVLVDAPCSGLGVLRRRPDARWRMDANGPGRLQGVQVALVEAALGALAPGGMCVYSVCTLTHEENGGVVRSVTAPADIEFVDETTLVPDADRDGMYVARWRRLE